MAPSIPTQTVAELDASFRELGAELKVHAPAEHARMSQLLRALKSGKGALADVKRLTLDLLRWQLTLMRMDAETQRVRFAVPAAKKVAEAVAADEALRAVIKLLDQALALAKGKPQETPASPPLHTSIETAAAAARVAVDRAEHALAHSTLGIPMVAVKEQPVSASGVRLAPVEPPKKSAAKSAAKSAQQKRPASPSARAPQKKR